MKQNIKRLWVALCMMVCLFALVGCSNADDAQTEIDAAVVSNMQMLAENYITEFSKLTAEDLTNQIATAQKSKDSVMETAFTSWE
ncbi:MAG: hypothetical protein IJ374_01080, partial [Lachnospiraceae bacterium]|nr:hypothetical protein [Lachnospiraceae bacterium]